MPEIPPDQAARVVRAFLLRCRAWGADREIPEQLAHLAQDPSPDRAAKLYQWTTWVAFVDHALHELDAGKLDHWFADDGGL